MIKSINGATFRKMILAAANLLEENKKFVDALNVFPVPDGDTGTNMCLTFKSATKEVNNCLNNNLDALGEALTKGALRGARGNSGVILSQILKGLSTVLVRCSEITTKDFAKALKEGADVAYKAVTKPKEGTILTVIRVMAETALSACKKQNDFELFLKTVLDSGEQILQQTPEMLPVLKKAGVVDAGGRGLLILFTGFYKVIINDESMKFEFSDTAATMDKVQEFHAHIMDLSEIQYAYCTEFMVINMYKKTTESDIDRLRARLMEIGDSVICIGDLQLVKVHVHTNKPNEALGNALELGEITNVKIENMLEQNRELLKATNNKEPMKTYGMISVAAGKGLYEIFRDLMVDYVIEGGQTMNPSANDIAGAADRVNAQNIFVFPNNKNIILAAEQAKALTNKNLIVIPTKSVPEGISACLSFNEETSLEENIEAMTASIGNVKTGAVTYAVRDTHVDGFDLSVGEIIGLDNNAILAKGQTVAPTVEALVEKLVTNDSVNISLFYGEDIKEDEANKLQQILQDKYPSCEVSVVYGGQPVYYYLISVE